MPAAVIQRVFGLGNDMIVDRWLHLAAPVQARYDAEHAADRSIELRSAILTGIIFYNIYNITSIVLLPDIFELSALLRLGMVTPVSLGLFCLVGRTTPVWTERLVTFGILNVYLVPVFLFWAASTPMGLFTFGELFLAVVYANMLLTLRFHYAVAFTVTALAATLVVVVTKAGLAPSLMFAFSVQIATACAFSLYANYRHEQRRCLDYVRALGARLRADEAEQARREFQDLSQTDALTGLPNRRHLMSRLEEWLPLSDAPVVMMIDIDHFKLYNDALGHSAGDECLRRVAGVFASIVARDDDVFCARYGGEEFTFVIRSASEIEAAKWAKTLVHAVAALEIAHPARFDGIGIVTISVGVARGSDRTTWLPADLIAAADHNLYTAKKRGRNGVVLGHNARDLRQGHDSLPGIA
ncbi:GGDEF domain-containing protein [Methylobacterium sp. D54C]